MAKTLLQAVNGVLKKARIIQGSSGELTSFTDTARQAWIDDAINQINVVVQELYSRASIPMPNEEAQSTITLTTGGREYTLPTDLEHIRWPLIDETNSQKIFPYPGGFEQMRRNQITPSNFSGLPTFATISPINGKLRMDTDQTADENGRVYQIYYDAKITLDSISDTFPFVDTAVDAIEEAAAQLFSASEQGTFDNSQFLLAVGRAARYIRKEPVRSHW